MPFVDNQGAKLYLRGDRLEGLRSSGFRSSPQTTPRKPRFAGRKGQIEPIGRTPMNVRYTSTSSRPLSASSPIPPRPIGAGARASA